MIASAMRGRLGGAGDGAGALSAAEAHRRAQAAEAAGDREGALAIYREAVRTHPKDPFLLGNYAVAVSNRSFVVRTNRGRTVPLRPTSHDRVGDARAALALLDETERIDPKYAEPALQRGLIDAAWGLPEDALVEFYKAHLLGGRQDVIDRNASAITRLQLGAAAFDSLRQNGRPASR